jgi:3',5'-nucleoside bisphosphate phosphatase
MLLEMHSHTAEHSACSRVSALDLVKEVYARGLEGLVITDHHYYWPFEELAALRTAAEIPDYFLILSGQEVTTADMGDVLVYGVTESLRAGLRLSEIRREYPEAALVWAHPFRHGKIPQPQQLLHPLLDGVEIFSSNHSVWENTRGLRAWHRHKFIAIAGTDVHGKSYAASYPTQFDHPLEDMAALVEELKRGRCRPFFKEVSKAGTNTRVSEITIGADGSNALRDRIIVRDLPDKHKWSSGRRAFRIMKALSRKGFDRGLYRVPRPIHDDAEDRLIIEQGLRGISFFEKLVSASAEDARHFTRLAAGWLGKLHNCRLQITSPGTFLKDEAKHLDGYLHRFAGVQNRHTGRIRELVETVRQAEIALFQDRRDLLLQGHGDYHPKNIYLGLDETIDHAAFYIAAIDFDSSRCIPPAFDVGTFLAQFRNQFFKYPTILRNVPEKVFLKAYLRSSEVWGDDFIRQVELFRARANLSIAGYLVKVGLGDSEALWRVIVEAERAIVNFNTP